MVGQSHLYFFATFFYAFGVSVFLFALFLQLCCVDFCLFYYPAKQGKIN